MEAARQARRDLGGMPPARVREILALATVPIDVEITRAQRILQRCAAIDADDLRSVGQIAALEAAQTFVPGRSTLRTWIGTCIRWRIAEMLQDAAQILDHEFAPVGPVFSHSTIEDCGDVRPMGTSFDGVVPLEETMEALELAEARAWVERSLHGLSPRQKILVMQQLGNTDESMEQIAAAFGVSRVQTWRDFKSAVAQLSVRARKSFVLTEGSRAA